MNHKLYAVQKNATTIGNGTIADLVDWLERIVNILVPANGIEYWYVAKPPLRERKNHYVTTDLVPREKKLDEGPDHVGVYLTDGSCEGTRIELVMYHRDDTYKSIASIKTFGPEEESLRIASVITKVMCDYFTWEVQPVLQEMHNKLPRPYQSCLTTSDQELITITTTANSILVTSASGTVYEDLNLFELGYMAKWSIENYEKDWCTVLTTNEASFVVEKHMVVTDRLVPEYLLTTLCCVKDMDEADKAGWYAIPPKVDHSDRSTYLGPYFGLSQAVDAAYQHLSVVTKKAA